MNEQRIRMKREMRMNDLREQCTPEKRPGWR
jgi:hypothetical protein